MRRSKTRLNEKFEAIKEKAAIHPLKIKDDASSLLQKLQVESEARWNQSTVRGVVVPEKHVHAM